MKNGKGIFVVLMTGMVVMLLTTTAFSQGKGSQQVNICTNPIGSVFNVVGTALADLISKHSNLSCKVKPLGGPSSWLPMIENGEVEFGIINARDAEIAYGGKFIYEQVTKGKGFNFLRNVAVVSTNMCALTTRTSAKFNSPANFKGKRLSFGYKAHYMSADYVLALLLNYGIKLDEVKVVQVSTYPDGINGLMEGRVDIALGSEASPILREAEISTGGIILWPADTSPEAVKRVEGFSKSYYPWPAMNDSPGVKKGGMYLSTDVNLVSSTAVSDDIVAEVTKVITEYQTELHNVFPKFKEITVQKMAAGTSIPYHEAAIKYFKEKGHWKK